MTTPNDNTGTRKRRAPKFWGDFWWSDDDKLLAYGVEADDKSLTFDGHFICLTEVPRSPDDGSDSEPAIDRANLIINALNFAAALKTLTLARAAARKEE